MANMQTLTNSAITMASETANAVTGIVTSVSSSVEILNNYVSRHRQMQNSKNVIELHDYKARLLEDTSRAITERKDAINAFLANNPDRTNQFNSTYAELSALLTPANA